MKNNSFQITSNSAFSAFNTINRSFASRRPMNGIDFEPETQDNIPANINTTLVNLKQEAAFFSLSETKEFTDLSKENFFERPSVAFENCIHFFDAPKFSGQKRSYTSFITGIDELINLRESNKKMQMIVDKELSFSASSMDSRLTNENMKPIVSSNPFTQGALDVIQARINRVNHGRQLSK